MIDTSNKNLIQKTLLLSFCFFLVKYTFKHPLIMILLMGTLYFGGRYMIYNHPEELKAGVNAVVTEVSNTGSELARVMASDNLN